MWIAAKAHGIGGRNQSRGFDSGTPLSKASDIAGRRHIALSEHIFVPARTVELPIGSSPGKRWAVQSLQAAFQHSSALFLSHLLLSSQCI